MDTHYYRFRNCSVNPTATTDATCTTLKSTCISIATTGCQEQNTCAKFHFKNNTCSTFTGDMDHVKGIDLIQQHVYMKNQVEKLIELSENKSEIRITIGKSC